MSNSSKDNYSANIEYIALVSYNVFVRGVELALVIEILTYKFLNCMFLLPLGYNGEGKSLSTVSLVIKPGT